MTNMDTQRDRSDYSVYTPPPPHPPPPTPRKKTKRDQALTQTLAKGKQLLLLIGLIVKSEKSIESMIIERQRLH